MKIENPFIITGYRSENEFCNRREETAKLTSAVNNGRNVTLYSLRRMGKTGLIFHLFRMLEDSKKSTAIYCDIYQTQSLNDFVKVFSNAVLRKLETKPEKFFKQTLEIFKNIRPRVSADKYTGEPLLEFAVERSESLLPSLKEIFAYLRVKSKKGRIVIAIDEFQQITEYPEGNIEAILRSEIQSMQNVSFIYSGSKKHMMHSMFTSSSRPFYQSTEMLFLNNIKETEYASFIESKFKDNNTKINDAAIQSILEFTSCYTYYVQYFCNKLYSGYRSVITERSVWETANEILNENEGIYNEYKNLMPLLQWNLLKAIAKERGIKSVTSMSFIKKYGLTAPSSINNSIKSLLDKELIYFENGKYYVYDLFFSRWLERLP
ncbi:MAG TPA: ATP-binding protein [Ignavibacteria bacterium]|nr:ATP-binding protein [Ignavibacteria bacterium]HMR00263.1 ATP-binding protein [Ignavibacteria bacterium]